MPARKPTAAPAGPPRSAPGAGPGAWVRANPKLAAGGAAAAAAVALGLRAKKKGVASPATTTGAKTSAQGGGLPTYDSTASDVYNSIQPEIEALQHQLTASLGAASNPHDALNPANPSRPPRSTGGTSGPSPLPVPASALSGAGYGAAYVDAHGTTIVPNNAPGAAPAPSYAGPVSGNPSMLNYMLPGGMEHFDPNHVALIQGAPGSSVSSTLWYTG